ncbi:AAA family ATPase [Microcoleus sp. T2B6]|uniref:AAA family ATPase n=1 Tax=Microcoleus sp. T2B6 TaxID=3055424 RepID=UPI002FCF9EAA
MKIISLRLKNNFWDWHFDEIKFSSNLTLLVGVSGAGKTQILRAIIDLRRIANGTAINGFEWEIIFSTVNGTEFIWEGRFDTVEKNELSFEDDEKEKQDEREKSSLIYEKLTSNNQVLIERNLEEIMFKNSPMPKLSSHQSMIYILKEESVIKEAFDALNKIKYRDHTINGRRLLNSNQSFQSLKNKYKTLDSIVNSDEDIITKLYLTYENKLDIYEKIKSRFIDIFPQIGDIKVEPFKTDIFFPKAIAEKIPPAISIKEKSVPKWIREDRMSSGMLRTIIHIAEMFLANEGSVILIDEFENSLGINCIDILTDDLIHENKTLQFIATSHHPYIINNIPYEYWKIVTRQGGHIRICNASDYHLGKSKQDAFIQLTKILEKQS